MLRIANYIYITYFHHPDTKGTIKKHAPNISLLYSTVIHNWPIQPAEDICVLYTAKKINVKYLHVEQSEGGNLKVPRGCELSLCSRTVIGQDWKVGGTGWGSGLLQNHSHGCWEE